jgi:formylmethanofuran dehydrogenase subunit E
MRVWWYEHFVKADHWPPYVREYMVRQGWKELARAKSLSPEKQAEVATRELAAALSDDEYLTSAFKSELLADGMTRLGKIPLDHCAGCKSPVFTHEAAWLDGKPYCKSCAPQKKN